MTMHSKHQTGLTLIGYSVTKNGLPFLDDTTYPSIDAAKQDAESELCLFLGELHLVQADLPVEHFLCLKIEEDPDSDKEIAPDALLDRYHIIPVYAEFFSAGFYLRKLGGAGRVWQVRRDHHKFLPNSRSPDLTFRDIEFHSRVEAIGYIRKEIRFKRERDAPRMTAAIQIAQLMGGAVIILSLFILAVLWKDGSLTREGWRLVWLVPVTTLAGVMLMGTYIGLFASLVEGEGIIHDIVVGVLSVGLLLLFSWMTLAMYRDGDWHFIIFGGGVLLGVIAALWEGGNRLLHALGKRR